MEAEKLLIPVLWCLYVNLKDKQYQANKVSRRQHSGGQSFKIAMFRVVFQGNDSLKS